MSLYPYNRYDQGPAVLYCSMVGCPHCTSTRPQMAQAAAIMGSVVPVYEVDSDRDADVVQALGVEGFPTILFRHPGGGYAEYDGPRKGRDIADWACAHSGGCGRSYRS